MTWIGRSSHLLKVDISKARAPIAIHFDLRSSVLAQTRKAGCPKAVAGDDIESPADHARVAAVLGNVRNGCWVRAAVTNPIPCEDSIALHGQAFRSDAPPPRRAAEDILEGAYGYGGKIIPGASSVQGMTNGPSVPRPQRS
jgi:hypothetical protein